MSQQSATSSWSAAGTAVEPLLSTIYPSMVEAHNPVVFLDIAMPALDPTTGRRTTPKSEAVTGGEVPSHGAHRVVIELYAHKTPQLAQNFYALCVGSQQRLVNGTLQPVGYRNCPVHSGNPGALVQTGDILHGDGRGVFSIFERGNQFVVQPPYFKEALMGDAQQLPQETMGLVVMSPVATTSAPATTDGVAVGCCFEIVVQSLHAGAATLEFFKTQCIVGRVIGRTKTEFERSMGYLQHLSKVAFQERKELLRGGDGVAPLIVQCGEM